MWSEEKNLPNVRDLKYIGCEVCHRAIKELYEQTADKRSMAPRNKVSEEAVEELVERICSPIKKNQKEMKSIVNTPSETESQPHIWTRKLDIVENTASDSRKYLALYEPGGISKCGVECATISRSCSDLLENELDVDALVLALWKNKMSLDSLQKRFCPSSKGSCRSKQPLLGSYKRMDESFVTMSDKELEIEKMMETMEAAGMGGMKMFSRDDYLEKMADSYSEDLDDYAGDGLEADL